MTEGIENAFPFTPPQEDNTVAQYGLTKREYFAAMAMQGILSNIQRILEYHKPSIADESTKCADALIDALNKKP